MGWYGHGIYDGDETQTQHLIFLRLAGIKIEDDNNEVECCCLSLGTHGVV